MPDAGQLRDEARDREEWTGPFGQEPVTPGARPSVDGTRHCPYVDPEIEGVVHGDQRATPYAGFNDDHGLRECRQDSIATWEVVRQGRRLRQELADDEPPFHDVPKEAPVNRRIRRVRTPSQDGERVAGGGEGASMGRAVDS